MLKKAFFKIWLGCLVFTPCYADLITVDPTNLVQNTITAKNTVESLINQKRSLELEIRNMQMNKSINYRDMAKVIHHAEEITKQGKALSYAMQDVEKSFENRYPDYAKSNGLMGFKTAYRNWDQTSHETMMNTLEGIHINNQDLNDEQALLIKLKNASETEDGDLRLKQVSNAIAINTNQQLMSLRQLVSLQSNAQTAYMSHRIAKESYEHESLAKIVEHLKDKPADPGPGFGKIDFHPGFKK